MMEMSAERDGFCPKIRYIRITIQIGAVYCRMIVLPAVVSLLAIEYRVVTPAMEMAPTSTVGLNLSLCFVAKI